MQHFRDHTAVRDPNANEEELLVHDRSGDHLHRVSLRDSHAGHWIPPRPHFLLDEPELVLRCRYHRDDGADDRAYSQPQ